MAKLDLSLIINIQADGADILKQNEQLMTESLESIIEDILPTTGVNYQAELKDNLTDVTVKRSGGTDNG